MHNNATKYKISWETTSKRRKNRSFLPDLNSTSWVYMHEARDHHEDPEEAVNKVRTRSRGRRESGKRTGVAEVEARASSVRIKEIRKRRECWRRPISSQRRQPARIFENSLCTDTPMHRTLQRSLFLFLSLLHKCGMFGFTMLVCDDEFTSNIVIPNIYLLHCCLM